VVTEWKIYADLDYERIFRSMTKPASIFDGRNILDHAKLHKIGFNVYPTGKPALTHY
jgi:UDPglucose 6-dehydrogenase